MTVTVRRLARPAEIGWAEGLLEAEFVGGCRRAAARLMDALEGETLVAELDGTPAGLVTYVVSASGSVPEAEIRALVTVPGTRGRGVASALLDAARGEMRAVGGVRRAWLVTTNDNLDALGFYQRRGWRLSAVRTGAVDEARRTLKPSIAEVAANGIPIRDEVELTLDV